MTRENGRITFKLDGKDVTYPAGTTILQAALAEGTFIPHFCYHPGLSIAGNCRMCLVEASNSHKPVIACATPIAQGIEVWTATESIRRARAGVLEFMLLNHPLDCPICDKAGECLLQDFSYDHGKDHSRLRDEKVIRHTKDLGPTVKIWGNRCIVCTRCVRFSDEVSGTGELTVVNRGDRSVVDVFPGAPLDNLLAGNVVDICPVGALISKDFLHRARVWFLGKTESICPECARGCNIVIDTLDNRISRITPRENPQVNRYWMCDRGRFAYPYVGDPARTREASISGTPAPWDEAARFVAVELARARERGGAVAGVASGFMTVEELHLFKAILEHAGSRRIGWLGRPQEPEKVFPGFRIPADPNPNRRGAEIILGKERVGPGLREIEAGLSDGSIRALVVFANTPGLALPDGILRGLERLDLLVLFQLLPADTEGIPGAFMERSVIVPAAAPAEKEGTFVNEDGRIQRIRPAVRLPHRMVQEVEFLERVLVHLGARHHGMSPEEVFREASEAIPGWGGIRYEDIGRTGRPIG